MSDQLFTSDWGGEKRFLVDRMSQEIGSAKQRDEHGDLTEDEREVAGSSGIVRE